ncbi:hypothetical protein [Streptomyces sp. MP131-18]|uniref:hypothetical protein n=1 Tax=Streptomyces sp. MP131-18 TaxID=1857892 RepID=UPI0009A1DF74|nr:hypothetical protein [Streptomyces sp. MP131-18]ONK10352.1 hypothetical protein STBA_10740 [Streptomyces sp. MP131-18]
MTDDELPTVIHRTREELLQQREELIARTGMTEEVLFRRAEDFILYPEHYLIYETVQGIDYLLGEG